MEHSLKEDVRGEVGLRGGHKVKIQGKLLAVRMNHPSPKSYSFHCTPSDSRNFSHNVISALELGFFYERADKMVTGSAGAAVPGPAHTVTLLPQLPTSYRMFKQTVRRSYM
jgi:hypothetical protein